MTAAFVRWYGFSPGTNQVRSAEADDRAAARALAELGVASADLLTLYKSIGDIRWSDVGDGYFVDPVPDVLLRLEEGGAVGAGTSEEARGLVIGSNGGGLCYAPAPAGWSTGRGRHHWTHPNWTGRLMICGSFWSCWSNP